MAIKKTVNFHYLLSTVKGTGIAGMAYLGQMCGVATAWSLFHNTMNGYKVVAHEVGHNWGFSHDRSNGCAAENVRGFMGARDKLSPCSEKEFINTFNRCPQKFSTNRYQITSPTLPPTKTCLGTHLVFTDGIGIRTSKHPNGLKRKTLTSCCEACDADPE